MTKPLKILVVDDTQLILKLIERSLRNLGYTVETANNGFEGLQAFQNAGRGHFDCVVTDIQMVRWSCSDTSSLNFFANSR